MMKPVTLLKFSPLVALLFYLSCATPPEYPEAPEIEFVRLSKDTISRALAGANFLVDTLGITVSFTDGDGDIGDIDTTFSLFFTDSRNGAFNDLKIPFVNEAGASSGIKGEITFFINAQCCIFPPPFEDSPCDFETPQYRYDPLTYDVYIEDRAGNQSNVVTTDTLYVRCFDL